MPSPQTALRPESGPALSPGEGRGTHLVVLGASAPVHVPLLWPPCTGGSSQHLRERSGSHEGRCWGRGHAGAGRVVLAPARRQTGNQRRDTDIPTGRHTRSHTESHVLPCSHSVHWDTTPSDTPRRTQSQQRLPRVQKYSDPGLHSISYAPCDPCIDRPSRSR